MSSKVNKILVPVDFSEQSLIALYQSYNLAKEIDAEIILIYVIEEFSPVMKMLYKELDQIGDAVAKNLTNLAEDEAKKTGLIFSTIVAKGKIYAKIVETAAEIGATLIMMGNQGNARGKFIGSNSLHVVKTSPCPVITFKGKNHKKGCDRILLPLDLSKETADKVKIAIQLAKIFNSEIYVLSVLLIGKDERRSKMVEQIDRVKENIEERGVKCSAEIKDIVKGEESLVGAVLRYSNEIEADLIMVMTQQENDFKEFFIGSRAQTIINNSEIPVLSIIPTRK
jgi:nucleotide-binding universal stress UspA family protein